MHRREQAVPARLDESRGYWCPEIQIGMMLDGPTVWAQCPQRP